MMTLLIYLAVGALSGLLAGLFGIGGGLIIVPILIYSFTLQGFSSDVVTHLALGTSLAIIIFTSLSSAWSHNKRGAVYWPFFRWMIVGIMAGAVFGAYTASFIPGQYLQIIIGIFALSMAANLLLSLRGKEYKTADEIKSTPPAGLIGAGGVIGWASAIFGIAGGSLIVPFLVSRHLPVRNAVGTSSACGVPVTVFSALGYLATGWGNSALPEWSIGFIYLPALLGIAVMSSLFAKFGVMLAHKLPGKVLQFSFACLMICIGLSFIFGLTH